MTENPGGGLATCAFCGARFPAIAARFCPACGRDVGTAPAIPPAPSATPAAPPATTSAVPAPPTQAPAFQYPQAYGQPQAGGVGPRFPPGYWVAPLPARRNRLPILVGLGVAGLVLVIVAGALVVAGAGSGKASLAPSPLAAASATAVPALPGISPSSVPSNAATPTPTPTPTLMPTPMPVGTFTATGSMATARATQTATLLADGRVLIAGGEDAPAPSSGVGRDLRP